FRTLLSRSGLGLGGVFVLSYGLKAEGRCNQLDLIEVETLVHRHHEAQFLEGKLDDLGCRHLHGGSQLGDGDEFVDPDEGLFPFLFLGQASGLHLTERGLVRPAPLSPCRSLHALQGAEDVGVHRFLIHRGALPLLPLLPAAALFGVGSKGALRRRAIGPRPSGHTGPGRSAGPGGWWRTTAEHRLGPTRGRSGGSLHSRRNERSPGRDGRRSWGRTECRGIRGSAVYWFLLSGDLGLVSFWRSGRQILEEGPGALLEGLRRSGILDLVNDRAFQLESRQLGRLLRLLLGLDLSHLGRRAAALRGLGFGRD